MKRINRVGLSLTMIALLICSVIHAAEPFVSLGFVTLPSDIQIGPMSAVAVDGTDRIYVLHRGEPPLLLLDGQHKLISGRGQGDFKTPHGLKVDPKGNVWVTDNARHVVYRMSRDGQITLTLGTLDKGGAGTTQLRSPDDLVFDSKGLIYVADAGNKRIAKFDADGKYLAEWGKGGKEPGQFSTAHGLAIDTKDRIYVADRGNKRVQVFNTDGQFQAAWTEAGQPFGLLVTPEGLIVSDGDAHRLTLLDFEGQLIGAWGSPETLKLPHLMALGHDGTVYVTEVDGKRVQMFKRVK